VVLISYFLSASAIFTPYPKIVTSQKGREVSFDSVRLSLRRRLRMRTLSLSKGAFPQIIEKIPKIDIQLVHE
ncbi:MAG: hypothetical protein ACI9EW_002673, partial [Cellvibrionaceae bacterium]